MTKQEVVSPPGLGASILTAARLLERKIEGQKKRNIYSISPVPAANISDRTHCTVSH